MIHNNKQQHILPVSIVLCGAFPHSKLPNKRCSEIELERKGSRPSLVIKEQSRNIAPPLPVAEQKHPEIEQKLQWNNEPSLNFMAMHPPFSLRMLPLLLIDVFWTSTREGSLPQQLMIDG
ncbi:uncharacterized protein MONOS_9615 [Monocercomonoides exilis]|uniref:uncharacterized protein n=1 Tax=Monocercomonoides exilis TaxID=2049356 RepID=UPI00355A3BC9|nr:hypothetical protein MONOS_9615 [Monocercomonoides exilis]|eukprot:MONOS_9615.1-p1 / transcript=MONOS_9615.1 / gene=MONOS_9615 / organism=Monocercomonoides_exilis_PA203 / gene_product=unspecified product / transcript_product=unspecified product / location=Mono_scaffold00402:53708-54164(+) / protein_length=120 / sequence_SO=supercontig / SO=protein_coding / is_pseudo=false